MEFNEFKVKELREAARQIAPETRGVGQLGHVGTKEQLIEFLQQKGIMPGEVKEIVDGNKTVQAPEDHDPMNNGNGGNVPGGNGNPGNGEQQNGENGDKLVTTVHMQKTGDGRFVEVTINNGGEKRYMKLPPLGQEPGPMTPPENNDPEDELEIIRRIITKNVKQQIDQLPPPEIDAEKVGAIVDDKLDEFKKTMVKTIEVKQIDGTKKTIGVAHYMTERVAQVCNLGLHQMLVGPAGGGKTTCAEKVAEILNLKFYPVSVGPQTTKSDLLGFVDAAGNYHTTPLRLAFENGGLLLLDEVDSANAGVLTIINSMLANGYCSFPDTVVQKHADFRCICACNTYGRGADRMYVGRNQLDAATLDRFVVVDFDYDETMEMTLAGNVEWTKKVQEWRKKAFELKASVVISPRASIFGAKLLAAGIPQLEVEDLVVWKGIAPDLKLKIRG